MNGEHKQDGDASVQSVIPRVINITLFLAPASINWDTRYQQCLQYHLQGECTEEKGRMGVPADKRLRVSLE